jgi:hypothetical protein
MRRKARGVGPRGSNNADARPALLVGQLACSHRETIAELLYGFATEADALEYGLYSHPAESPDESPSLRIS